MGTYHCLCIHCMYKINECIDKKFDDIYFQNTIH